MTDETTITLPRRKVQRFAGGYQVVERKKTGWHPVSKFYPHSTSALAKLGRLVQADSK
jgi:hypothetical protein